MRFGDSDGAGVMHFHQLLRWCHEAWEESLERFGLPPEALFPMLGHRPGVALPIRHCSADFLAPIRCGDRLTIVLDPRQLDGGSSEVHYALRRGEQLVARALSRHCAIAAEGRRRCDLPEPLIRWLQGTGSGGG